MNRNPELRREPDSRYENFTRLVLVALAFLFVIQMTIAYFVVQQSREPGKRLAAIQAVERELGDDQMQLVEACNRLQIIRIEDNVSHYADWRSYKAAAVITRGRLRVTFLESAHAKTWVPRTDCRAAVRKHGSRYRPPGPVAFDVRRPPRSALTLTPDLFRS